MVIPELEALPDIKRRFWTEEELRTLWRYQNKDLRVVAKHLGKTTRACEMRLLRLREEREGNDE